MPRKPMSEMRRDDQDDLGGASGDVHELDMVQENNGAMGVNRTNGGPNQPLPALAPSNQSPRQQLRQLASDRQALIDQIVPAKRFRVVGVPRGAGGDVAMIVGQGGRGFRINEGKEIDERYYDVPSLRRQGVKLEEIKPEPEF